MVSPVSAVAKALTPTPAKIRVEALLRLPEIFKIRNAPIAVPDKAANGIHL